MSDALAIQRLADRLEPTLRRQFLAAVRQLQARIPLAAIVRALEQGQMTVELALAINHLPTDLQPAARTLNRAFAQAAAMTTGDLRLESTFRLTNTLAVEAADVRSAVLVRQVTAETRRALQQLIAQALREGILPKRAARLIQPMIGLTARQARAVLKQRAIWEKQGMSADRIAAAVDRYTAQLLKRRAELIARTETIRASVDGQLAIWKQAQRTGLLPSLAMKRWVVTPDDRLCPRCAPLAGVEVALDADFPGGVMGPPLHPQCRCAVVLAVASLRVRQAA